MGVSEKPCERHQQRRDERAADQDWDGAPTVQQARCDQGADQIAHRVEGVHAACYGVGPRQVFSHGRQQQGIRKTGHAKRNGRRHRNANCQPERCEKPYALRHEKLI